MPFPTVRVGFPWAPLEVADDPVFTDPAYERGLMEYVRDRPWPADPVFVDVGAHQGIWSTFLAALAGPGGLVYAVEPHPDNLALLAGNCRGRPGAAPVAVLPFAAGDADDQAFLSCYRADRRCATGIAKITAAADEPDYLIPVAVRRLDSLLARLPKVDFVKIDVEHAEAHVLRGARGLLARDRPALLVETHSDAARAELLAAAAAAGWAAARLPTEIDATDAHWWVTT